MSSSFSVEMIRAQVDRILASEKFVRSPRLSRFLRFAVEEVVQGRGDSLKEYVIGVEVFQLGDSFKPGENPIVRVEARNLRAKLQKYYASQGADDSVVIEFPTGGYVPVFRAKQAYLLNEMPATDGDRAGSTSLEYSGFPHPPSHSHNNLEKVHEESQSQDDNPTLHTERQRDTDHPLTKPAWQWKPVVALFVFVIAVFLGIGWWLWSHTPPQPPLIMTQLTFDPGSTKDPTVSRDGNLLAYSSDRGESRTTDIWVQPMSGGRPVRLTTHEARDENPDFSPDGTRIAFRSYRDGGGIYVVSLLGGDERRIAGGGFSPRFSPDGDWIAYSKIEQSGSGGVYVIPSTGGEPRKVETTATNTGIPVWTPDGQHLLFCGADEHEEKYDWWVAPLDLNDPSPARPSVKTAVSDALRRQNLPEINHSMCPCDWIGNQVIFTMNGRLWQVPISFKAWKVDGPATQVLYLPAVQNPRVSGRLDKHPVLVFSTERRISHIWSLPIDANRGKLLGSLEQLTRDTSLQGGLHGTRAHLSADGKKLVFSSRWEGNRDIWLKDLATGKEVSLSSGPWHEGWPLINFDGSKVAYRCVEDGKDAVYVTETAGLMRQMVCEGCSQLMDWSPDEKGVLYVADRSLCLLEVGTGKKQVLLKKNEYEPMEATFSPDGSWIALVTGVAGKERLQGFLVPFNGVLAEEAKWIPVTDESYELSLHWSPDGNLLYFLHLRDNFRCLYAQRLHPASKRPLGPAFPVRHFHNNQHYPQNGSWISVARNKLAVNLSEAQANIWMTQWPAQP